MSETEQAIGLECAGAAATVTFNGSADWTSPQTHNTPSCYKGVVVDVNNIVAIVGASIVNIFWADDVPTTQPDCEASRLHADVFEMDSRWKLKAPVLHGGQRLALRANRTPAPRPAAPDAGVTPCCSPSGVFRPGLRAR